MRLGTLELRARHAAAPLLMLLGAAFALRGMGRVWWCSEGDLQPWSLDIWSPHNSQHLVDPYTITHVMHGVALYGLLWLLLRSVLSAADRGLVAVGLEVAWEIVENTETVIERYRETTVSLNYYGDSIVNSIGDTLAFVAGYALAATIPVWVSAVGFFVTDALLLLWIRDSLLLNVLMLVVPIEAIKRWQLGERESVRGQVTALASLPTVLAYGARLSRRSASPSSRAFRARRPAGRGDPPGSR